MNGSIGHRRPRVNLFVFILFTMSFAWLVLVGTGMSRLPIEAQLLTLFFAATVWFGVCVLFLDAVRWAIARVSR